jgi:prepilin-type N-terminal cleavage/methylation domain-containing protein
MTPTTPHTRMQQGGFSLIETMIVLVVIGLTLAAGTPFVRGYMHSRGIGEAANDLVSQLDLARNRAIAENNPYRVLFDSPVAGQYRVHDDDDGNGSIDEGEALYGPFTLPGSVAFDDIDVGGTSFVTFEPSGMLAVGQGGQIILTDDRGRSKTLEVYTSGVTTLADDGD